MSISLVVNNVAYNYPQDFDTEWGVDATGWAQAVTNGLLQMAGGPFPLTAQVNFGPNFGITTLDVVSQSVNPASTGVIRLAKADTIVFRNNANTADLALAIDGSNALTFNGVALGLTSLTDNHIFVGNVLNQPTDVAMSGDATIVASGAVTISAGAINNSKVASGAAIAINKLATLTPNTAIASDAGGFLISSSVNSTELGYLSGVTGPLQAQLVTYLPLSGGTMSGPISMASNKITALAAGTVPGEAMAWGQALTGTSLTLSGAFSGATSGSFSGILTLGDQLRVPDGNVTSPAYSFVNETNTGVYRSASHEMSIAVNGQQEIIVQPKQVFIGGKTQDTQPSELLHAEGWGGVIPNDVSADIIVYNTNNYAGRLIASTSSPAGGPYPHPIVTSYLTAYGYNDAGPSWSGGPSFQDAAEVALQNSTHQLFRIIDGGATTYFWNDGASGVWSFRHSSSGTEDAQISEKGMIPARLASDPGSPTEGTIYYNTATHHWFGYNGSAWKQLDN